MYQDWSSANNNSPCTGCHYWRGMSICYGCHYILVEGRRRGCPPGEGCTKKKPMDMELTQKENRATLNRFIYRHINDND